MDVFICCTLYIHVLRTYAHFRAFYPPAYLLPTHAWVLLPCAIPHSAQLGLCVCTRAPPHLQDVACIALTHPSARCLELPAFVVMPQPAYQSCFTLVLAHKHAHIAAIAWHKLQAKPCRQPSWPKAMTAIHLSITWETNLFSLILLYRSLMLLFFLQYQ